MQKYLQRHWGNVYNLNFPDSEPCMFLNKKGCGVRGAAAQCRTFPFWPENMSDLRVWKKVKKLCPGVGKGKNYAVDEIIEIMVDVCFGPFL